MFLIIATHQPEIKKAPVRTLGGDKETIIEPLGRRSSDAN
jgi:hypothetical protein